MLKQKNRDYPRFLAWLLAIMVNFLLTDTRSIKAQPLDAKPKIPSPLPPTELPCFDPFPSSPPKLSPNELPEEIPETITVERFQFEGNTVFSDEELAQVIESFTNRPISLAKLLQARSAVTQYYIDQGYVTSGAYI